MKYKRQIIVGDTLYFFVLSNQEIWSAKIIFIDYAPKVPFVILEIDNGESMVIKARAISDYYYSLILAGINFPMSDSSLMKKCTLYLNPKSYEGNFEFLRHYKHNSKILTYVSFDRKQIEEQAKKHIESTIKLNIRLSKKLIQNNRHENKSLMDSRNKLYFKLCDETGMLEKKLLYLQ